MEKPISFEELELEPIIELQRYATYKEQQQDLPDEKGIMTFYHNLVTGKRDMDINKVIEHPERVCVFGNKDKGSGHVIVGNQIIKIRIHNYRNRIPEKGKRIQNAIIDPYHETRINNAIEIRNDESGVSLYVNNGDVIYENPKHFLQSTQIIKKKLAMNGIPFIKVINGNEVAMADNISGIKKIISYIPPVKKSGKNQEIADYLMKKPLPVPNYQAQNKLETFMKIDRVPGPFDKMIKDENVCVIRTFYQEKGEKSVEIGRVYVIGKKTVACKIESGEAYAVSMSDRPAHWNFPVRDFDKTEVKGTILEYMGDILENETSENAGILAYMSLKSPIFELMSKNGMREFVRSSIPTFQAGIGIKTFIEMSLGIEPTAKNLKAMPFSASQLKYLSNYADLGSFYPNKREGIWNKGFFLFISGMWNLFETGQSISSMDATTFKRYADMMADIYEGAKKSRESTREELTALFVNSVKNWGINNVLSFYEKHQDELFPKEYSGIYINIMLLDYVKMVSDTQTQTYFKLNYQNKEKLKILHDNVMVVYDLWKDEIKQRNIAKALLEQKYFEWDNENYPWIVKSPKDIEDITREGNKLNHCVAHYCDKVIDRDTNILFIREKTCEDKPFFTMEITKYKEIRQVHGVNNRNVDTEEGLTEFIKKYAKAKKLKIENIDRAL